MGGNLPTFFYGASIDVADGRAWPYFPLQGQAFGAMAEWEKGKRAVVVS